MTSLLCRAQTGPVWADGIITHCDGYSAAAATTTHRFVGLGIDTEPVPNSRPRSTQPYATTRNRSTCRLRTARDADLQRQGVRLQGRFPMTGQWLDFFDVTVMVDTGAGIFRATSNTSGLKSWLIAAIEGRFCVTSSFIHTAAVVSSTQRPNLDHETTRQHDDRERFFR